MNFDPIHRDFNADGHKAFSDYRELSFIQSSLCRSGNVVSLDDARKHAATLHGSQSGADPGPSNPAGCHLTEKCRFDSGSLAEGLVATRGGSIP